MKASILFTLFAFAASAVARTPACVLGVVNEQDDPSDVKTICGKAKSVQSTLASACGSNNQAAQKVFADTCNNAGVKVAAYTPSSSSASPSKTTGSPSSSATHGAFIYTSAYYNSTCSCSMTVVTSATSSSPTGATGLTSVTGTASSSGFGFPAASTTSSASGASQTASSSKNMAGKSHVAGMGSAVAAIIAVAGVVLVL